MSTHSSSVSAFEAAERASAVIDKARLRRFLMIGGVVLVLGIAAGIYLTSGRYVGSDNSYVHANKLMVSTDVSCLIKAVYVREGQAVKKNQVLFTLDSQPFQIALDNAKNRLRPRRCNSAPTAPASPI